MYLNRRPASSGLGLPAKAWVLLFAAISLAVSGMSGVIRNDDLLLLTALLDCVGVIGELGSDFLLVAPFIQPIIERELRRLCSLLLEVIGRVPLESMFDSVEEWTRARWAGSAYVGIAGLSSARLEAGRYSRSLGVDFIPELRAFGTTGAGACSSLLLESSVADCCRRREFPKRLKNGGRKLIRRRVGSGTGAGGRTAG